MGNDIYYKNTLQIRIIQKPKKKKDKKQVEHPLIYNFKQWLNFTCSILKFSEGFYLKFLILFSLKK